ncbi:MAG TPA: hypothetical protein VJI68_01640 [Candidatus Nanoarchaeia archaeon]|nr:hypothetical protein [Candidatus Nanoarchaeia archaeon]
MVKKGMNSMSKGMCTMCQCNPCKCGSSGWCIVLMGIVVAVLGLLMIFPFGWFTFEHSLGLVIFLFGLKKLWWGFKGCH